MYTATAVMSLIQTTMTTIFENLGHSESRISYILKQNTHRKVSSIKADIVGQIELSYNSVSACV